MLRFLFSGILLSLSVLIQAQTNPLKHEIQLVVDNDAFTGDLDKDQYYSSGIYASYRVLRDSVGSAKVIRSYQFNHRMFTPSWIGEEIQRFRDRPYAGTLSGSVANEYYLGNGDYLRGELEIGWMGPKALVGETQRAWHRFWGMTLPLGWDYQISDTPLLNVHLKYIKPFFESPNFEMAHVANTSLGTVFSLARYEMLFRLGNLRPLNQSAYTGSSFGNTRSSSKNKGTVESYIFYAPGLEYVIYNATLQGSPFNDDSPFTVEATKLVWQQKLGVMFSWEAFDLGFTGFWRKKENPKATNHNYVGIRLNRRF